MADHSRSPDFRPTASWPVLRARAGLLGEIRRFFDERGYLEVETPLLSHDVCVDLWLDPFIVPQASSRPERGGRMFLQTSPEFAMKRLLAAGADAIYQITRSFRRGEIGRLHNPEFTIVEWYRTGESLEAQMDLTESLVRAALETERGDIAGARPGSAPRPIPRFRRLAYDDAFLEFGGQRILPLSTAELRRVAERHGLSAPASLAADDRDGWLNLLLAGIVEPALAGSGAVFLYDYPASQAALARLRPDRPEVAERFELYLDGLEICNGYRELTDPDLMAERMRRQAALRASAGLSELPADSRLIEAMRAGLPECAGVALGFDRLLMWRLGAADIAEVMPFPFERA